MNLPAALQVSRGMGNGVPRRLWIPLVLLVPLYVVLFTDWLNPAPIEVVASVRAIVPKTIKRETLGGVCPVAFSFDGNYRLSSVQVVEENPGPVGTPRLMWHLKSGFWGSWPAKMIVYGTPVKWMNSGSGLVRAETLKPGVKYRLIVRSGRRKGEVTFQTRELAGI